MRTMREIAETVAAQYGVTVEQLKSPERSRPIAWPRQEAMWLMRRVKWADGSTRYSNPQIGQFLGGRDHTTVLHGVRAYEARLNGRPNPSTLKAKLRPQAETNCGKVRVSH